jgi:hypothetical protein
MHGATIKLLQLISLLAKAKLSLTIWFLTTTTHDTITNYNALTEIEHPDYVSELKWEMHR